MLNQEEDQQNKSNDISYYYHDCDSCKYPIRWEDTFFRCEICEKTEGDVILTCLECVSGGSGCYDSLHALEKVIFVNNDPKFV